MKCNKCNKEIPDYSIYCLYCGTKINNEADENKKIIRYFSIERAKWKRRVSELETILMNSNEFEGKKIK